MLNSFKVNRFYVFDILDEEGILADCDETVLGGPDFDHSLHGTALEGHVVDGDLEGNGVLGLLRLVLDELGKVVELSGQLFLRLSLPFLLLQLVQILHASSASAHIYVVCHIARLLEELDVLELLVSTCHDRVNQRKMDDRYQLVFCARLEERVLHVREGDVDDGSTVRMVSNSILMNF